MDGFSTFHHRVYRHPYLRTILNLDEKLTTMKKYYGDYSPDNYSYTAWHPSAFMKEEINCLPFERKTAVLYNGGSISNFFKEEHTPSGNPNQRSILKSNYIQPGNDENVNFKDSDAEFSFAHEGVFSGLLECAAYFSNPHRSGWSPLINEIEFPTESLEMLINLEILEAELEEAGFSVGNLNVDSERFIHISSSADLINLFGSKEKAIIKLRELFKQLFSKGSKESIYFEKIQFATSDKVKVNQITRLWPLEYSKYPVFMQKSEFLSWIVKEQKYREKLPESVLEQYRNNNHRIKESELEKLKKEFYNEEANHLRPVFLRTYESFRKDLKDIEEPLSQIIKIENSMKKKLSKKAKEKLRGRERRDFYRFRRVVEEDELAEELKSYNDSIEEFLSFIVENYELKFESHNVDTIAELNPHKIFYEDRPDLTKRNKTLLKSIHNSFSKIEKEEKENRKRNKGERFEPEKRLKKALQQNLESNRLLNLRPLEQNLKNMNRDEFVKHNIKIIQKS